MHRLHRERVMTLKPNATLYLIADGVTHRMHVSPSTYASVLWYFRKCSPEWRCRESPDIKEGDVTITCIACIASAS